MWSNGYGDQQPQEVQSPAQALSGCVTLGETLHLSELLCAPLWKVDDTHATLCCVRTQCVESAQGYACYIYLHTGRSRTGGLGGFLETVISQPFPGQVADMSSSPVSPFPSGPHSRELSTPC